MPITEPLSSPRSMDIFSKGFYRYMSFFPPQPLPLEQPEGDEVEYRGIHWCLYFSIFRERAFYPS
jgi:hypothetical protein